MAGSVLVIDDDRDVLHAARLALAGCAERVETRDSTDALDEVLKTEPFDVVLLDMNFAIGEQSGREGLDQIERIRAADAALAIVLMTTFGGVSLAVDGLKRGAADFILKPWRNDKLVAAVAGAAALTRAGREAAGNFDLDAAEKATIRRALDHHDGNVSKAAVALGLTRPALYRRMAKHGL